MTNFLEVLNTSETKFVELKPEIRWQKGSYNQMVGSYRGGSTFQEFLAYHKAKGNEDTLSLMLIRVFKRAFVYDAERWNKSPEEPLSDRSILKTNRSPRTLELLNLFMKDKPSFNEEMEKLSKMRNIQDLCDDLGIQAFLIKHKSRYVYRSDKKLNM